MKNKIYRLMALCFLLVGTVANAQQQERSAFYRQHMNILNPAYAGANGNLSFIGTYRSQWQGIRDAPESQAFSVSSPVGRNVGLGLSLENQQVYIEKQTSVNVDFSYSLRLNEEMTLFLGLKAGGNFYDVNAGRAETWNYEADPSLVNLSRFNPNLGLGAYLEYEDFFFSLSAPRLFETSRANEDEGIVTTAADRPHYYLSGGYDFGLSSSLRLKPSVMLRYVEAAPLSADFTAMLNMEERFELGLGYRTDKAITSLALIKVFDWLDFGYAYDSALRSDLQLAGNGSHELFMRLVL